MAKSFFLSIFILFCCTIIESSILSNISFLIAVPDLILICSVYFSIINGSLYGELTGFTSGLFLDFITGVPMGFNCIFRTIIGYICGIFSSTVILSKFVIPIVMTGIATILKALLIFLITLFYPNVQIEGIFSYAFLFELLVNMLLAPLIFKLLGFFYGTLSINNKDIVDNAK